MEVMEVDNDLRPSADADDKNGDKDDSVTTDNHFSDDGNIAQEMEIETTGEVTITKQLDIYDVDMDEDEDVCLQYADDDDAQGKVTSSSEEEEEDDDPPIVWTLLGDTDADSSGSDAVLRELARASNDVLETVLQILRFCVLSSSKGKQAHRWGVTPKDLKEGFGKSGGKGSGLFYSMCVEFLEKSCPDVSPKEILDRIFWRDGLLSDDDDAVDEWDRSLLDDYDEDENNSEDKDWVCPKEKPGPSCKFEPNPPDYIPPAPGNSGKRSVFWYIHNSANDLLSDIMSATPDAEDTIAIPRLVECFLDLPLEVHWKCMRAKVFKAALPKNGVNVDNQIAFWEALFKFRSIKLFKAANNLVTDVVWQIERFFVEDRSAELQKVFLNDGVTLWDEEFMNLNASSALKLAIELAPFLRGLLCKGIITPPQMCENLLNLTRNLDPRRSMFFLVSFFTFANELEALYLRDFERSLLPPLTLTMKGVIQLYSQVALILKHNQALDLGIPNVIIWFAKMAIRHKITLIYNKWRIYGYDNVTLDGRGRGTAPFSRRGGGDGVYKPSRKRTKADMKSASPRLYLIARPLYKSCAPPYKQELIDRLYSWMMKTYNGLWTYQKDKKGGDGDDDSAEEATTAF